MLTLDNLITIAIIAQSLRNNGAFERKVLQDIPQSFVGFHFHLLLSFRQFIS